VTQSVYEATEFGEKNRKIGAIMLLFKVNEVGTSALEAGE